VRLDAPLITARLELCALDESHADGPYLAWMNDPEVMRYTEARFASHDRAGLAAFVETMNGSADNLLLGLFARDDGGHIGNIKLGPLERPHGRSWIGIVIGDRSRWGRGLATEAIGAVADHGLRTLGLRRVLAGIYGDNEGSRRAFERAGFREIARIPGHCRSGEAWVDDIIMARDHDS